MFTKRLRVSLAAATATVALLVGGGTAGPAQAAARGSVKSYTLNYKGKVVLRWNPCAVIHYRVNTRYAPAGALPDVQAAVAVLARDTGMKFRYDGATSVVPTTAYGSSFTPGKAAPPMVITWAAPGKGAGKSDLLTADEHNAGAGGYRAVWWRDSTGTHSWRIITGYVVLNTRVNDLPAGFGAGEPTRGQLLLHELGHAVGLNHTQDSTQVMYPVMGTYGSYGAGDLAGLKRLGRTSGCIR